ncbi:unnamed protein product [Pleuronectes platessa]|uniref:Uncharacterized protein n=1 Tax=Pleuronectes platessa TaxID=8262 RepID=A0A9N7U8C7_PLEPL|nr:unnamed protein product [Pleuronectes platessa]
MGPNGSWWVLVSPNEVLVVPGGSCWVLRVRPQILRPPPAPVASSLGSSATGSDRCCPASTLLPPAAGAPGKLSCRLRVLVEISRANRCSEVHMPTGERGGGNGLNVRGHSREDGKHSVLMNED